MPSPRFPRRAVRAINLMISSQRSSRANYFELQCRRQMMNFEWTGRIKKRRPFTAYSMHLITGHSPDAGVVQIAHDLGGDSVQM